MWCRAALACRSPPRETRWRSVSPDLTGMGAVPHSAANEADVRSRSGLSPAVIRSWAPMTASVGHRNHQRRHDGLQHFSV